MGTTTEITKAQSVEVIPSSEMKGLVNALGELKEEGAKLAELKVKAEAFTTIRSAEEYSSAGEVLAEVRDIKKIGGLKIDPFLAIADRVMKFLRNERSKHEIAADAIGAPLAQKMSDYKRQEREAAAREEQRINEERRKAAEAQAEEDRKKREAEIKAELKAGDIGKREAKQLTKQAEEEARATVASTQAIRVEPNIPKVPGLTRKPLHWTFKIINPELVPRPWCIPDESKIGVEVRKIQDKEKAEALIKGIEVSSEDRV